MDNHRDEVAQHCSSPRDSGPENDSETAPPAQTPEAFGTFPAELKARNIWVGWRYEAPKGNAKRTKVPYRVREPQRKASPTDPSTWAPFELAEARVACFDGLSFCTEGDVAGIDFDDCIDEAGQIDPEVWAEVQALDSYTEVTPSGRGLRTLLQGSFEGPGHNLRKVRREIYCRQRFFAATGAHLEDTPFTVNPRQVELDAWLARYCPPATDSQRQALPAQPVPLDDQELLGRMTRWVGGAVFADLWVGNWRPHFESQSEADASLLWRLAFATGRDPARMERMARASGLARPKWDDPRKRGASTWLREEIAEACTLCRDVYTPRDPQSAGRASGVDAVTISQDVPSMPAEANAFALRDAGDPERRVAHHDDSPAGDMTVGRGRLAAAATSADLAGITTDDVLATVREAVESGDAPKRIFGSRETLGALARVRATTPAAWALVRANLRGHVNLNDLDHATRTTALRLVSDDDEADRIPRLLEDAQGYSKQRIIDSGPEAVPLSNFLLTVRERLALPDGEEVIAVTASFDGGAPRSLDLPHSALLGRRDLLQGLRTSEAVWLGTDRDVQLLRAHLLRQEAPRLQGVETMGRHRGHIVLPGLSIGCDGPMEPRETRLVDLHGHALFGVTPRIWPTPENHLAAASAIYEFLPGINQAHIVGGLVGWVFALPWAALIRTVPGWGGFPHLVQWGTTGSGKTGTAKTAWRLCGVPFDFEPFSLPGTQFTRLRKLACTNLVPIVFDEYRPGSWRRDSTAELHHELRSAYGGELAERGTPSLGSRKYPLCAPVILAGEDRPRDPALDHRMIVLHPDPEVLGSPGFVAAFEQLHRVPLEAFCLPYWAWALAQDDWSATLGGERDAVRQWAQDQRLSLPPRVLNNLAIVRLGWTMFRRYAEHLGLTPADLVDGDFPAVLSAAAAEVVPTGGVTTALDDLMRFVAVMVANGRLRYGVHFVEIGAGLVLPLREVLAEARRYARETEREQPLLGEDAYRGMVAEAADRPNGYVIATTERGDFHNPSGGGRAQRRGVLLDVDMLDQKLEIDPEIWDEPRPSPDKEPGQ
jgi:primase-polymerase (primpol)-like protein